MDKNKFLRLLNSYRKKVNKAHLLNILSFGLCIGFGVGSIFQLVALVVPFYYAALFTGIAVGLATSTALLVTLCTGKDMEQVTLFMDSFGFQERITTAYEQLHEDGEIAELQRKDAMKQLIKYGERIQIKVIPGWKRLLCMFSLLVLLCFLQALPSEMKELAKIQKQVSTEAEKKEEELTEIQKKLEELAEVEELTPKQQEMMQKMIENLQNSVTEYKQATNPEMINEANRKLEYKYGEMGAQMMDLAQMLEADSFASAQLKEDVKQVAEQMQKEQGNKTASNQNQQGQSGQGQPNQQNQGGQNNAGNQQNPGNQQGNGNQGNQGNQQPQGGQQSQGNQQNPGSQQGNGNQENQGNQQPQGGQQGQGNQQGQSTQSGQGNQAGEGNSDSGSGGGRGEGTANAPRDYVSIPNEIVDQETLKGTAGEHVDSQYFQTQNGLTWEGQKISHEQVIGSYEQNAYEGISKGKYPSGMEDVIKEYFTSFE